MKPPMKVGMAHLFLPLASKTIISTGLAEFLKMEFCQPPNTLTVTALGALRLSAGNLQKIKIGTYEISDVPVLVTKLPPELGTHCALGTNVLRASS